MQNQAVRVDDDMRRGAKTQRAGEHKKSSYSPPSKIERILLSSAIAGTGRFPERTQMDLLSPRMDDKQDLALFYAGDVALLQRKCVAIVGTRQVSEAGVRRTRRLARELVEAGVVIVSGLAMGVDTVAHRATIESGGKTVAVIGTPLDKAYPAENAPLQESIYREHLLVSQFRIGERTFRASFPQRNKLMATISDATVVMEASDTSGTLHQAAECTRLGRWLFIAKSVADDPSLKWPKDFLRYSTCAVFENVADITSRILT